jgi:DnaJ-class molecular chaperone
MNKNDLAKLYRQKAHEHHPDKGGDHDEFVRLTEAYEQLVRMKD